MVKSRLRRPSELRKNRSPGGSADWSGSASVELDDGGLAVYDKASPTNVHLAYQGEAFQIEVFSPEDGEALRLVENGKIKPVP